MDDRLREIIKLELDLRKRKAKQAFIDRYAERVDLFGYELFDWEKLGSKPTSYQMDIWNRASLFNRLGAMAPRGSGKSTSASIFVLHAIVISELLEQDWKVVTTASVFRQLERFLWPEIHKFRKLLRWDLIPLEPFPGRDIMKMGIKGNYGEAFAANSDEPELIEGAHAQRLYYLFDEAKKIKEGVFDSVEGAFSNVANESGQVAKMLMISTPGMPEGRFWQIMTRQEGYEDWEQYYIELKDVIASGRISQEFVDQRKKQWGEDSSIYKMHILGHFPDSAEEGVIPRLWVMDAVDRWEEMKDSAKDLPVTAIGADPGGDGQDLSIYARRYGKDFWGEFVEVPKVKRQNEVQMANALIEEIEQNRAFHMAVDANGAGAGVFGMIQEWYGKENRDALYPEMSFDPFVASESAKDEWGEYLMDSEGLYKFADRRAAAWWHLRTLLNPSNNPTLCLPPDNKLIEELTAPKWKEVAGGRIRVESKDDLRKPNRLGRSTDKADCIVMALAKDYFVSDKAGFWIM